jgi:hypothetical protein
MPKPLNLDLGPPSPEALAWKCTSAGDSTRSLRLPALTPLILEMAPGGADYLLAYAALRAQQPVARASDADHSSRDAPLRPAAS